MSRQHFDSDRDENVAGRPLTHPLHALGNVRNESNLPHCRQSVIGCLWKFETIGDCYKCVSGGICPCDNHADRAVCFACAAIDIIQLLARRLNLPVLSIRVGVATGPLTAAVVGSLMPRYLIYGSTCQGANTMVRFSAPLFPSLQPHSATCIRVSPQTPNRNPCLSNLRSDTPTSCL